MKKKKILLLSDDLRMHSGIATVSKDIVMETLNEYDWVQIAGAIKHPDKGKVFDMSSGLDEYGIKDGYLKIYPVDGYGDEGVLREVMAIEKPDAILPTMGGQTALNTTLDLNRHKILQKYKVKIIGASIESIDMAEDRELFKNAMIDIGLETPTAYIAHNYNEALQHQKKIGFPILIRPSFTLGGSGGGIAYNIQDFETIARRGLELSPTSEVLIEESVIGWKEFEMEVVRDKSDNCIIICSIENIDPMGVHTGDSITVAPAQTLTDKEFQKLRNASIQVLRKIGVDTGGSNVQFAISPHDGRILVIEMNPRVSRSSALASKATGFPIAKIAAKLAIGYTLDELSNEITGNIIPASFEPSIDYVVTKIPRFAFEKFKEADNKLTTQMKSVGEVMAIGRNFKAVSYTHLTLPTKRIV